MTEDDLRDLLRESAKGAPVIPVEQLLGGLTMSRPRRVRREVLAVWGAGLTAACVTAAVTVVAVSDHGGYIAQRPVTADQPGTAGSSVPVIGGSGTGDPHLGSEWTSLSFTDTENGWAAGTSCTTETASSCHVIVARTTDGGATWLPTPAPTATVNIQGDPIPLATSGDTVWIANYTSNDSGATWSPVVDFSPEAGTADQMTFSPSTRSGLAPYSISITNAETGTRPAQPLTQGNATCVNPEEISRLDGSTVVQLASIPRHNDASGTGFGEVAPNGTMWLSRPADNTRSPGCGKTLPASILTVSPNGSLTDVPATGGWNVAAAIDSQTAFFLDGSGTHLGITHDGGRSIEPVSAVATSTASAINVVNAFSANDLILTSVSQDGDDAYVSHDGGKTFQITLKMTSDVVSNIVIVNATTATITDPAGHVYRTDDTGNTWHQVGTLPKG